MAETGSGFGQRIAKLGAPQRQDAVLDEICRAYEKLSALLRQGSENDDLCDTRCSLAGLEAELATYLTNTEKDTP